MVALARERPAPVGLLWLFVLPFAALTAVFGVWPIVLSVQTSFTASASALKPSPTWVGLANYASIFADPVFLASLWRTLLYTLLAVISTLSLALLYALLLNSVSIGRGRTFFKLAVFLPVVTPDIAGYVVWRWLYDQSIGAINVALGVLHLPAFGGLASTSTVLPALLVAESWHHLGFYVFIFLANLALCDKGQIEAATMDGANEAQILFSVVLPLAMPVVATASIITFLLNWAQWLPVLVVSRSPDTYTLPVALMNLNGELGVNFQGIMALSVLTTIPVTIFFLIAQRRVMSGMTAGAVKG